MQAGSQQSSDIAQDFIEIAKNRISFFKKRIRDRPFNLSRLLPELVQGGKGAEWNRNSTKTKMKQKFEDNTVTKQNRSIEIIEITKRPLKNAENIEHSE